MTCIAQIFKLTHREQNLFSSLQNFKHIFCFTHILQFKMAHFKCTEHSSLHKTQQSDIKSHVCHFKTLPFKITLHELIGHYMCHLPNNCYRNCYHFNQEVSTKRPQVRGGGGGSVFALTHFVSAIYFSVYCFVSVFMFTPI